MSRRDALATTPVFVDAIDGALDRAVALARRGPANGPNPRVGSVVLAPLDAPGVVGTPATHRRRVLGEGWHRGAGTPHAEVAALRDARERGADVRGASVVVTLEPCSHHGRTPPCVEALVRAGVAEVRYAVTDPNPRAAGGAEFLRAHGVRTAQVAHAAADELVAA